MKKLLFTSFLFISLLINSIHVMALPTIVSVDSTALDKIVTGLYKSTIPPNNQFKEEPITLPFSSLEHVLDNNAFSVTVNVETLDKQYSCGALTVWRVYPHLSTVHYKYTSEHKNVQACNNAFFKLKIDDLTSDENAFSKRIPLSSENTENKIQLKYNHDIACSILVKNDDQADLADQVDEIEEGIKKILSKKWEDS